MPMRFTRIIATLAVLWGAPCLAQSQISPEVFLDQAVGHTLTFTDVKDGHTVGIEKFLARNRSVWAPEDGFCSYGVIKIRGPLLCFLYEDYPDPDNCWMPFQDEAGLLVMSRSTFQVQRITAIDDTPVTCEDAPIS
ncbi:MAG: hypothetical protein ACSHXB_01505 [Sulfitobacter sp.]